MATQAPLNYQHVFESGWRTGVHDCRGLTAYHHPWLAVCYETRQAIGCYSRDRAREVLKELKAAAEAKR